MSESKEEKIEPVVVRLGHGANCSSIGSVVDTLFVGAVLGSAIFAAVAAAMKKESVTIAGKTKPESDRPSDENHDEERVP